MSERRRPPETATGYYVFHQFHAIDWPALAEISEGERADIVEEASTFLDTQASDGTGDLACYSIIGHKADLLVLVLCETLAELDTFERQFAQLRLARFVRPVTSALGPTEASGYSEAAAAFFDPDAEADPGIQRYMNTRLYPTIPDAEFLSFYFMDKRREPGANWYDLPYDERASHVQQHGEIGKAFAGRVTQMITGTVGFDDWEWGVTLFSDDMTAIKDLLTTMRYDPSTSRFAEFGRFYVGRRFPVADLEAFLEGEAIPTRAADASEPTIDATLLDRLPVEREALDADTHAVVVESTTGLEQVESALDDLRGHFDHYDSHVVTACLPGEAHTLVVSVWSTARAAETAAGFLADLPGTSEIRTGPIDGASTVEAAPGAVFGDDDVAAEVRSTMRAAGVHVGQPHGEELYALVVYSDLPSARLDDPVDALVSRFEEREDHHDTRAYTGQETERTAVVSLWTTAAGAETAAERLTELPGIERPDDEDGFTTMGLFYRVKPAHREAFLETFDEVREVLEDMDGHRHTELLINVTDEHDMFIASRWREKGDAMAFFASDAFRETVQFGRDVLADRPRHVFLV